jgi:hypothetical protein
MYPRAPASRARWAAGIEFIKAQNLKEFFGRIPGAKLHLHNWFVDDASLTAAPPLENNFPEIA